MQKYFLLICVIITNLAFANNLEFQRFENQYNIGYEFIQMNLVNGNQTKALVNEQAINLEIEHLFDLGIWLDANFNLVTNYNQPNLSYNDSNILQSSLDSNVAANSFGQNPFMYSLTLKGGYAFNISNTIQLIPYGMFGRNANWAASTVIANGFQQIGIDYFLTGGFGLRSTYKVNNQLLIYGDFLYSYNWDNSGAIKTIQIANFGKSYAATNYQFTTTLGLKYNITDILQVGINGFWNYYTHQSNIAGMVYIPQNTFGEMITVGLTY